MIERAAMTEDKGIAPGPWAWPLRGAVFFDSAYGPRPSVQAPGEIRNHNGLDLRSGNKTVFAVARGRVLVTGSPMMGLCLRLDHGGGLFSLYAHLSATLVNEGEVAAGDEIGIMGSSGSFAPEGDKVAHLHFGAYRGWPTGYGWTSNDPVIGRHVDPFPLFGARPERLIVGAGVYEDGETFRNRIGGKA